MAKKTIHIDIAKSSINLSGKKTSEINLAIKECRKLLNSSRRKAGYIAEEVADRIAKQARLNFAKAQYDGVNDVVVYFDRGNMANYVPYFGSPDSMEGQYAKTSEGKETRNPNNMAQRIVRFEGRALYFIEFGAGVHYNPSGSEHPWLHAYGNVGKAFKDIYPIGQYKGEDGIVKGKGRGDAWVYYGQAGTNGSPFNSDPTKILTHGNPPNRCIYNAVQSVKGQLPQIFATAKYGVYY